MDLSDLLKPDAVLPSLHAQSKKQVLQEVCALAARLTGLAEREIFDTLLQRERLGSTGVGQGVAIPHGKLRGLDRLVGVFARLARPVDFEFARRSAGRSRFPAAGAGERRRRSSEGARPHRPRAARSGKWRRSCGRRRDAGELLCDPDRPRRSTSHAA